MTSRARRGAPAMTATPASASSSASSLRAEALSSKRSRAARSDGSSSGDIQTDDPIGTRLVSSGSKASPPIRRRTTQTKAVAAPRSKVVGSKIAAAGAVSPENDHDGDESTVATDGTKAARPAPVAAQRSRNGRARRVVDSDSDEEEESDKDTASLLGEKEQKAGDASRIDQAGNDVDQDISGEANSEANSDDDVFDATMVEQSLLSTAPAEPAMKRARIASSVQTVLPPQDQQTQVKEEYRSPSPVHSASRPQRSPSAIVSLQPPSSSSPRTPESHRESSVHLDGVKTEPDLLTPAPHRTPRAESVSTVPLANTHATPGPSKAVPDPPKTRLVIHKMVLRNFKSYAGEQTIGPFHKSFSAVVGPNGSGKSNVIDAMLFVFGWRANKMRQGKLSELIHNSAGSENIGTCTVEVWFRDIVDLPGPDDYKVVPNSRLIVARTAYRNNTSVYTMNSKKSSFTEVTTLLKGRGIDLDHKRFLILQGEVESIAQMPPKAKNEHEEGLLEYLEDIIGTSSYKTPIEEASKKVDELNDVRGERLARLKIVQKEKDSLEGKKREAETFLRDQNGLTSRQSALWQVYILESKDEMHIASTSMEKLRKQIDEETEKNAGSRAEMQGLEQQFKSISHEYEKCTKEVDMVAKEVARLEKEDVQLQEKRKHLEAKKKKLAKSLADDKKAMSEASAIQERSTEELTTLADEVIRLESSLEKEEAELDKIRESLKGKTEAFNKSVEEKQRELQPWTARRNGKQNAKNVALEERRLLEDRFSQAEKETDQAKAALIDLETATEAKSDERDRLKSEKVQQSKKARQYEEELKGMQTQETALRNKAAMSRAKCEDAKIAMQSNQSRGEVLSGLTRQADLGMIKGFHGRLGNLGIIDDKYDVAISTACPGLDNIVVEGVETGQACIEHLRRNNLGRANFILLNSLAKMNMGRINTPENVPRLFDLVQPREPRFASAFYHQLRDTLVASDLAQANRLAYGATRYRVVTLDGQLIDKSGTMSGGGTRVARGAMSSKPVAPDMTLEQLSRLDKERQLDQDTLANHVKYVNEMRGLLEAAQHRIPEIDMEIEKLDMDLGNSGSMIEEAKKRIDILRSQHGPDANDLSRVAELTQQIERLDGELAELAQTTSAIEADIASLQEKILEAGGLELRTQKSKVDGIRERLDLLGERTTKAEVAKSKAEKDLAKLSKALQKNEEAHAALETESASVQEEISSQVETVAAVRKQLTESQFAMESKQDAKDDIKAKLDTCTEGINAFRSFEVEIKQKLEDNQKNQADNEKRVQHWQEKLAKLFLHRIDGDDDDLDTEHEQKAGEETSTPDIAAHGDAEASTPDARADKSDLPPGLELQEFSPDELRGMKKDKIKDEIAVFEEKLANGHANLSVLEEYKRRENEFLARAHDLDETTQERDRAKEMYDNLRKERLESFMAGFSVISAKLKEMYQTITLGGNAELELVDSLDPFSEGILFSVMPPRKSWKNISNLSGGEKTLSSLALVFALHAFKPTPLYAMDELDAALDFRNVSIVANLIKERTKGAQFIVISLRNNMFELASRLVGIYKTNGQTKSLAVHNSDLHAPLAAAPPPQPPRSAMASRTSQQPWATPRAGSTGISNRSVAPTPMSAGLGPKGPPPSTVRRMNPPNAATGPGTSSSATSSALAAPPSLMTPAPSRFMNSSGMSVGIPQTPRTGNIKGLQIGLSSSATASSIKLTSSHSVRGGLHSIYERSSGGNTAFGVPATPLSTRRPN